MRKKTRATCCLFCLIQKSKWIWSEHILIAAWIWSEHISLLPHESEACIYSYRRMNLKWAYIHIAAWIWSEHISLFSHGSEVSICPYCSRKLKWGSNLMVTWAWKVHIRQHIMHVLIYSVRSLINDYHGEVQGNITDKNVCTIQYTCIKSVLIYNTFCRRFHRIGYMWLVLL